MPTLTPYLNYLDGLILTAVSYPSGFSYSLYAIGHGTPDRVSTLFLAYLVLPYLIVAPAVWLTHLSPFTPGTLWAPSPFSLPTSPPYWAAAVALAPLALLTEFALHA